MKHLPRDFSVLEGDARERLAEVPDESVQTCVTSPPYWGLRDYGVEGQLGLEPTPEAYVENLVQVFREVRRVLRPDGTLWLNVGDSYSAGSSPGPQGDSGDRASRSHTASDAMRKEALGLKPKDLVGVPWRLAFALQRDGWWLRSDIVWHKPNPTPESVTDRPTKAHEHVFLLAKSRRYFYDHEAIKEDFQTDPSEDYPQRAQVTGRGDQEYAEARGDDRGKSGGFPPAGGGRNKRDVWTITTRPFPDAHFAVYPPELVVPCVRAGTPEAGSCEECGALAERQVERKTMEQDRSGRREELSGYAGRTAASGQMKSLPRSRTVGWERTCDCDAELEPALVLDPFAGAGTTGVVCSRLGRRFLGVELNPEYAEMARRRIRDSERSLFAEASG